MQVKHVYMNKECVIKPPTHMHTMRYDSTKHVDGGNFKLIIKKILNSE